MKDRSRLVTFAALVALVVAMTSLDDMLPSLELVGESVFWVLFGVLVFFLVRGGCSRSARDC